MGLRTWLGLKRVRPSKEIPAGSPSFFSANSYSQLQQDQWVLSETNGKRGGFFVEIGAFDGVFLSNTYLLESQYGWSGILAEPNPLLSDKIRANRSSFLCTSPVDATSGKSVTMRFVDDAPEYSSMADRAFSDINASTRRQPSTEIKQTTVSLNDLLHQHRAPQFIDFISIDTEGNEVEILSTFDFQKYNVGFMCVEHNFTEANEKLDNMMNDHGYERVFREWSQFDAWFRKSTV